jgi:metal-responsive CopG/Arc/MetJ family transcriptional regulator
MRTTINIKDGLLEEAERLAGQTSPSTVVNQALEEFIQARLVHELRSLRGKIRLSLDWRQMEEEEMAEYEADHR